VLTLPVETLVQVVAGELVCGPDSGMVNGIAIDSRKVEPGMAFIALPGARVDGHRFIGDAVAAGARAVVLTRVDDEDEQVFSELVRARGVAFVLTADAVKSLQALAGYHRGRLFCPVVGVTGSTGKTTTKDFLTSVLSQHARVVSTQGNQNNELGVPLTLLRAGADTDVLIVEMAMRGQGQIAQLCEIARPVAGLVTNVGTSHIELLGTQEAIASAKGELVRAVPEQGRVFLNGDDALSVTLAAEALAEVVFYGLSETCDVRGDSIKIDPSSCASFELVTPAGMREVALAIPGRHNVYNALAAAAVALYLEMPLDDVVVGLEAARSGEMRMQSFHTAAGIHVINDAYNANPSSMRAAIETLAEMQTSGRKVAVLGDMAELGSLTELAHFRIGERVAALDIDILVTVGQKAKHVADGARVEGMDDSMIRPCVTLEEAGEVLDDILEPGDVVLVKASRSMGLERVVEGIVEPRA
jgi:UDP-N-acetylmuramoyl-tripeptide--D-alanyl-D-alanine ligase